VSCDADPDLVERVLLEETTRGVAEVTGLLAEPAPSVLFSPGFGASSLDFTLLCSVVDINAQQPVQHALRKRILKRFIREGITIPYPTRTVFLQDTALKKHEK
jgi:small-conductance mechanosensitive channel